MKGNGNSYNFEYRMHDPRVGRFFAIDPLSKKYPYNSPYTFSENKVIAWKELEGCESFYAADGTFLGQVGSNTQVMVVDDKVIKYQGGIEAVQKNLGEIHIATTNPKVQQEHQAAGEKHLEWYVSKSSDLGITNEDFINISEVIYAESSNGNNSLEVAGIYSVIENRAKYENTGILEQITNDKGVRGAKASSRKRYYNEKGKIADEKRLAVRSGIIKGILNEYDYSKGAYYWDGSDFSQTTRYATSYEFTDTKHDIYNLGSKFKNESGLDNAKWNSRYKSTNAIGGTIFSRLNNYYRDGQYPDKINNKTKKVEEKRYLKKVGNGFANN